MHISVKSTSYDDATILVLSFNLLTPLSILALLSISLSFSLCEVKSVNVLTNQELDYG